MSKIKLNDSNILVSVFILLQNGHLSNFQCSEFRHPISSCDVDIQYGKLE